MPAALQFSLLGLLVGLAAGAATGPLAEDHPVLPTWKCTTSGGCVQQNTSIVLDRDSKLAKGAAGSRSAADYTAMGVTTSGNALTLQHYVNGQAASPRVYLLDSTTNKYVMMTLQDNQELSVDVDLSSLPCGENGAFYLSEMAADGSGGAGSGTGYCDAQCPSSQCCNEMDILEANSMATAMTPHPCKGSNCDKSGCGYNPYASGQRNYWGPGKTVDTSKVFTVVTQFAASGGKLTQITRKYIQNGKEIGGGGTISNCGAEGGSGGLTGMGQALGRGMVLAMSIWNDPAQQMAWLDAGSNGPCASGQGSPSQIQSQHSDTHVVFSNIRWGDIGSTTKS
ncbi:hypothetical protein SBRCBS47491_005703 [Sporothrix bragantina]|uniref:cellulase n=1 Tax=Sporothrix bragantina TaxID=671064 RepID=A0ABP0BZ47_9PEZI